jgi:hypothetical protein
VKHLFVIYFLLGLSATAFCQTAVLTGLIRDAESKTPLELATITIFAPDSSLVTYQLSDKTGKFAFDKLPLKKKLRVAVTYTGYAAYNKFVQLNVGNADTLDILLSFNDKDTNSVVVTSTIPIRMNGDTLEINPNAFKLKPDAVVEELLNQVSGIMLWSDGTITVNGKQVQSLLVDGKPFMGSTDSRVATQNLPKSAIEKIQLYQEYDRSKMGEVQQPQDSLLTMNIKLKEDSKKGYFGKAGAGYGTTDRFEGDLSFQVYNKRSSGGIGGGFNNINKSLGNLQEMFQDNTYRTYNPNLYNVGRFGTNGINKNHSFGAVFSHSFIETANSRQNNRVTVNYNKSGTDANITDLILQNRTTIYNPQLIREEGVQNNVNDKNELGINYVKTNSYNDNLTVNGSVNSNDEKGSSSRFTEVRDSANQLQSTSSSSSHQQRQSDNEAVNLNFSKSDYENPLKSFSIQLDARQVNSVADRDVISAFQSFIDASKNTSYNRHYTTNNSSLNISGTMDYRGFKRLLLGRYNLFGINVNFTQSFNYNRLSDDNVVTDFDSTRKQHIVNTNLSINNKREVFEYTPSLSLSKYFSKYLGIYSRSMTMQFRLLDDIKTDKNISSFAWRNLNRSFQFFRYEGNMNYQYQKQSKYMYYLSTGYTKNFEYPSVDVLYTIVDDINVYNTRVGNPFLRNRINHTINFNGNFNTQNPQSVYSINSNLGGTYNRSLNPVVDSTINDPSGRRISYYTNADKGSNLSLNYRFNISRRFKKNSIQLMYDARYSKSSFPNYIDGLYNISETGNLSNQLTMQFSLRSILILNLGETLQHYTAKQTANGLTGFKNYSNSTRLGVVLNYPNHFTLSSTADYIGNSNLAKPTILCNAFASYRFMKQQGELKLSAMDILKQYQNIINSVNAYGTTTRITNGLRQFFLLTFSYYPRKFGKTEIKRQR